MSVEFPRKHIERLIEVGVDSDAPATRLSATIVKSWLAQGDAVTIPLAEYNQLQKDAAMLNALEAGGVDNWEGYSDACASLDDEEE